MKAKKMIPSKKKAVLAKPAEQIGREQRLRAGNEKLRSEGAAGAALVQRFCHGDEWLSLEQSQKQPHRSISLEMKMRKPMEMEAQICQRSFGCQGHFMLRLKLSCIGCYCLLHGMWWFLGKPLTDKERYSLHVYSIFLE